MPWTSDDQLDGATCPNATAAEQKNQDIAHWEEIEEEDDNMLIKLERPQLQEEFFNYLESQTAKIKAIVSQHLFLQRHQHCTVADRSEWLHGDFNTCIPISISNWRAQRILMRCPFPHMLGLQSSKHIDEKVRCEAATLAWIPQNCPQVPVPRLWGFGLPNGSSVSGEAMVQA
jgi:hypothetical protein